MKTLVRSKIVLSENGTCLTIYLWKKTFWMFGYWHPFSALSGLSRHPKEKIEKINDNNISRVLYNNFVLTQPSSATHDKLIHLKRKIHQTAGHTFAGFGNFHLGNPHRGSEYADLARGTHLECVKLIEGLIEESI